MTETKAEMIIATMTAARDDDDDDSHIMITMTKRTADGGTK
jgi:hypothetical protein